MRLGTEEICVKEIENGIRGLKMGTRRTQEVYSKLEFFFKKLRNTNEAMADDLENQLMEVRLKVEVKVV